ncbi:Mrh transcription modulator under heat shock [Salmonella phage STML-198]|uniref:Uncharacterized protein n=1 Tax=Salmonella phage STML-198 TaxID=1204531 RepID=K4I205_9CAUD|nr:Mrh transcription modulator under heat shock [Salmonella phage STML-198]AFU63971.1 hypothetical protein [Salmonella phage STML-198]UPW42392.1 hypothetical protein EBPHNEJP_00094 [Salmonella phage CF-SP2]
MKNMKTKSFVVKFYKRTGRRVEETREKFEVVLTQYGEPAPFSNEHYNNLEKQFMKMRIPENALLEIIHDCNIDKCENSPFGMVETLLSQKYIFPEFNFSEPLCHTDGYGTKIFKKFIVNTPEHIVELEKFIWHHFNDTGIRRNGFEEKTKHITAVKYVRGM